METGPVSKVWLTESFRGQLPPSNDCGSIASSTRPSPRGRTPLHLASVLGLDPKTAIRYADNARMLLVTVAEQHDPLHA